MDNEIYRLILVLVLSGLFLFAWQYYQGVFEGKKSNGVNVTHQVEKVEQQKRPLRKDLSDFKNCGRLRIVVYPIYKVLEFLYKQTTNLGLALILLTLAIRILLAPLMLKQLKASKKMTELQSEIQKIKKIYGENTLEIQKAMGKLFKDNGVRPFSSFGMIILQVPVFIALYKIVREGDIFSGASLGLWVQDLCIPDPYFILPIAAGLMMLLATGFSGQIHANMPKWLRYFFPALCVLFLLNQPAGLALYFLVGSVFQLGMNIITMNLSSLSGRCS